MMDGQEPEKRENPYKKQNLYKNKKQPKEAQPSEEQAAGKTENFVTRNVKLITFLVCVAVFLVFLGPWSVWRIVEWVEQKQEQQIEADSIPLRALLIIADKGTDASWTDFRSFERIENVSDTDGYVTWRLELCDAPFSVVVSGPSKSLPPQSIRVFCMNGSCDLQDQEADLYKDDIAAFVQAHQNNEN